MSIDVRWVRTLRTIVVTGLLLIALLGAVLGSIGRSGYLGNWVRDPGPRQTLPAPGGSTFG